MSYELDMSRRWFHCDPVQTPIPIPPAAGNRPLGKQATLYELLKLGSFPSKVGRKSSGDISFQVGIKTARNDSSLL